MSNKEPFDNIEALIRKAAEESTPDFEEAAWMKMNALLDEKDRRRRVMGWLWLAGCLLLLLGGGAAYFATRSSQPGPNHSHASIDQKSETGNSNNIPATSLQDHQHASLDTSSSILSSEVKKPAASTEEISTDAAKTPVPATVDRVSKQYQPATDATDQPRSSTASFSRPTMPAPAAAELAAKHSSHRSQFRTTTRRRLRTQAGTIETVGSPSIESIAATEVADIITNANPAVASVEKAKSSKIAEVKNQTTTANPATSSTKKSAASEITAVPQQPDSLANTTAKVADRDISTVGRKPEIKKAAMAKRGVYLLGMAGADMGSVRLLSFSNSKVIVKYGAGIGYQLNKHWSVQTGIYISNKQYTAGAGDYKPKTGSYWYGVDIRKVDAACMIFEIPLSVRYTFITRPTTSFYAMAGASSYIMKKEDYHYHYMRYGQYYQKYWQYTGNRNWMADVTLAAGIEKRLSTKWAILAEPSVSIPVAGIGDGNVRLFSASIQLGAKWMPF